MVRRSVHGITTPPLFESLEPRLLLDATAGAIEWIGPVGNDLGEIHGQKWHDLDADGVRHPGEPGLDGWTIELVDPATNAVIQTTTTQSEDLNGDSVIDPYLEQGLFAFTGLGAGVTSCARFDSPDGIGACRGGSALVTKSSPARPSR